jgi:CTP:molybdopterin cytidylyltransferase MocA/HD superfamily phosphodiesterase
VAPRLSAVILAAGLSSRMGELKATLPLGTNTIMEQCLQLFRDCGIEDLVVVTGHRSEEIRAIAEKAGARMVHNPDFTSGMYSSIRTGVRHISKQSNGFFLLPVDIPLVRAATINLLIRSFKPSRITYPVFDGKRGHPPLVGRDLISTIIKNVHPKGGLRSLLAKVEKKQPKQVVEVIAPDANILFDMDTPEDYTAGLRRLTHLDYPTIEECAIILKLHPMPQKGLAHGRLVAKIAMALCQAIARNGRRILDPELCRVCGWLHDIAKGNPNHEQEGSRWLRNLGFERAAEIVAAHKDLNWLPGEAITEKEIVHLADKLAHGSKIVDIRERFEEKLVLHKDNPEAVDAILRRYEKARQIAAAIEAEAGQRLNDILSDSMNA